MQTSLVAFLSPPSSRFVPSHEINIRHITLFHRISYSPHVRHVNLLESSALLLHHVNQDPGNRGDDNLNDGQSDANGGHNKTSKIAEAARADANADEYEEYYSYEDHVRANQERSGKLKKLDVLNSSSLSSFDHDFSDMVMNSYLAMSHTEMKRRRVIYHLHHVDFHCIWLKHKARSVSLGLSITLNATSSSPQIRHNTLDNTSATFGIPVAMKANIVILS
ncbi:hypothetical protein T265_07564 [Opisthorchis viverrini]|uniref:Uncharacterized protein n=1 Tax=Opisthorchis viverrini TaxID=6198 RepID=A0A075AB50_OPIVI|nr:hypothetical protein T265_07564 [Opisthorchis viverrini]KER24834.1 hypothetical protein T265_07564 [Opisthorchis viverrini]